MIRGNSSEVLRMTPVQTYHPSSLCCIFTLGILVINDNDESASVSVWLIIKLHCCGDHQKIHIRPWVRLAWPPVLASLDTVPSPSRGNHARYHYCYHYHCHFDQTDVYSFGQCCSSILQVVCEAGRNNVPLCQVRRISFWYLPLWSR